MGKAVILQFSQAPYEKRPAAGGGEKPFSRFGKRAYRLRPCLPGLQVDTLVFQRSSQPFDEDVVQESAFPIPRNGQRGLKRKA